jgi:hypothetical protein
MSKARIFSIHFRCAFGVESTEVLHACMQRFFMEVLLILLGCRNCIMLDFAISGF